MFIVHCIYTHAYQHQLIVDKWIRQGVKRVLLTAHLPNKFHITIIIIIIIIKKREREIDTLSVRRRQPHTTNL